MMDNPLEELQWQERLPRTWMSSHYDEELLRTSPMQHILSPIANNVRHTQHKEDGDVEEAEERHRPRRHDDAPRRDRNIHTRVHFDPSPHMTKNSSSVERHSADALPPRWYDGVGLTPPSVSKSTHRSSRSSISSQDVRGGRGVERELLLREREVRFYQTESVEMSSRLAQAEQEKEALRQRLGGAAEVMSARMKMQEMVRAECLHVEEAERWKHCAEEAEERGKLMAVMMIEVVAIASSSSITPELRHDDDGRVSGALLGTSPRVFNAASTRCDVDEFSRPRHPTPSRGDERLVEQVRVLSSRLDAREEELMKMKHRNQRERHSLERDLESERTLTHEMQEEMDDLIISELVLHETVARERMRREAAEGQADVWGQWISATQHHHQQQQQQHGVVQVFDAHTSSSSSSSSFPRAEELQGVLRTSVVDAILSHVLPLLSPRVEEAMSTMREAASMMQSSSSTVLHHHAEYMQSTSREAARVDARLAHVEELLQQAGGTPEMMSEIVSVAEEVRRAQTCVAALTDAVKRSSRLSSHNDVALNAKMSDLLSCQSAQCRTMLLSAAESMAMEEPHTTSPPRPDDEELSPLMPATMPPRSSSDVHVGASGGAPSSPATPSTSKRAAPLITKSASSLSMLMERSSNSVLTQVEDEHLFCPRLEMPSQDFDLSLSEDESIPSARDVRASFSSFRTPYDA